MNILNESLRTSVEKEIYRKCLCKVMGAQKQMEELAVMISFGRFGRCLAYS